VFRHDPIFDRCGRSEECENGTHARGAGAAGVLRGRLRAPLEGAATRCNEVFLYRVTKSKVEGSGKGVFDGIDYIKGRVDFKDVDVVNGLLEYRGHIWLPNRG